jgi:hypothetical protein
VFVAGDDVRLADWGDACITHPLVTLHVPITFLVPLLPAADRPAATRRLRDVYLDARGTGRDERDPFALAFWLGHVVRAISIFEECGLDDEEIPALLGAWERGRSVLGRGDEVLFAG